jgi:alpha-tubulin suppressor-like RCC1 family protein
MNTKESYGHYWENIPLKVNLFKKDVSYASVSGEHLWVLDKNNRVYSNRGFSKDWSYRGKQLKKIEVGEDGFAYGLDLKGSLKEFSSSKNKFVFHRNPMSLLDLYVSAKNNFFALTPNREIIAFYGNLKKSSY